MEVYGSVTPNPKFCTWPLTPTVFVRQTSWMMSRHMWNGHQLGVATKVMNQGVRKHPCKKDQRSPVVSSTQPTYCKWVFRCLTGNLLHTRGQILPLNRSASTRTLYGKGRRTRTQTEDEDHDCIRGGEGKWTNKVNGTFGSRWSQVLLPFFYLLIPWVVKNLDEHDKRRYRKWGATRSVFRKVSPRFK